jgi:hypothetical protein
LWATSHGSEIVLAAAAVEVVLVNTAYRDGQASEVPVTLRWAGSVAALSLPVLVAISGYGLALRVGHRGWTETRIMGLTCVVVSGCYAAGYAWAAIAGRPWLKRLEQTNIAVALVILLAIVALTTFADPARLSVADQVSRLETGRLGPDEFDFRYLRFDTARYGLEALDRLKNAAGPNTEAIKRGAERALALSTPYAATPPTTAEIAGMAVFPPGQTLPLSFVREDWNAFSRHDLLPICLFDATFKCEAFITVGSAGDAVIIVYELAGAKRGVALQQDARGAWRPIGTLSNAMRCDSVREALRIGKYSWVPALQMDLEAAGRHLTMTPPPTFEAPRCQ